MTIRLLLALTLTSSVFAQAPRLDVAFLRTQPYIEFDPAREVLTLKGRMVPVGFQATGMRHQVAVRSCESQKVVCVFPRRSRDLIQESWNGRDAKGAFPGYGQYRLEIAADCDQGVRGSGHIDIGSEPPLPGIVKVENVNSKLAPISAEPPGEPAVPNETASPIKSPTETPSSATNDPSPQAWLPMFCTAVLCVLLSAVRRRR